MRENCARARSRSRCNEMKMKNRSWLRKICTCCSKKANTPRKHESGGGNSRFSATAEVIVAFMLHKIEVEERARIIHVHVIARTASYKVYKEFHFFSSSLFQRVQETSSALSDNIPFRLNDFFSATHTVGKCCRMSIDKVISSDILSERYQSRKGSKRRGVRCWQRSIHRIGLESIPRLTIELDVKQSRP